MPVRYAHRFYRYPQDRADAAWLLDEIAEHRAAVDKALRLGSFNPDAVIGFVPLFGHRALVAFSDPALSPVLSVVGDARA